MRLLICSLIAAAILVSAVPCVALAQQGPGIPEAFHGAVSGAIGSSITASISGVVVASTTIETGGVYGYAPHLFFIPDPEDARAGATISFAVSTATLGTALFANGVITTLNLLAISSGAAPVASSTSTSSTTSPSVAPIPGAINSSTPSPQLVTNYQRSYRYHLTGNHTVGAADLSYLLAHWGLAGVDTPADINSDGTVDLSDFTLLLSHWSL
jgi:hypothetical protein